MKTQTDEKGKFMDLSEVIKSTNTCRFYQPKPVADEDIAATLDAARFGPSGGNRQPVSFIVVKDNATKKQMQSLYLPFWETYIQAIDEGMVRLGSKDKGIVGAADHFARNLAEIPVFIVVCAQLADCHATDTDLGRLSIVGGASIYPAVQNVLLKARSIGLGTALTTLLCHVEPQIKQLLNIPEDISTAAMITMGWPSKKFPTKLCRRPLSEIAWAEKYGSPLTHTSIRKK
jgi:nitroreductase